MSYILAAGQALKVLFIAYAIWNIITFLMFGIDKWKAKKNKWRISEGTLIWCAFVMGGLGAFLGSKVFHHKTQKTKFRVLLPLALLSNIILIVLAVLWLMGVI